MYSIFTQKNPVHGKASKRVAERARGLGVYTEGSRYLPPEPVIPDILYMPPLPEGRGVQVVTIGEESVLPAIAAAVASSRRRPPVAQYSLAAVYSGGSAEPLALQVPVGVGVPGPGVGEEGVPVGVGRSEVATELLGAEELLPRNPGSIYPGRALREKNFFPLSMGTPG